MKSVGAGIMLLLVSGWIMGTGCVTVKETIPLQVRAQRYWDGKSALTLQTSSSGHQVNDEQSSLYRNYVSSESRADLSEAKYLSQMKLRIWNPEIMDVKIKEDGISAVVTIRFDTKMQGIDIKGVQIKEDWVLENGQWMVKIRETRNPFRRKLL